MEKKFKCKDEVIYRVESENALWTYGIFSHYINYEDGTSSAVVNGHILDLIVYQLLPYEGNEHLVGTDSPADEEVRLEKGEWVMYTFGGLVSTYPLDYNLGKFIKINEENYTIDIQDSSAVRGSSKFVRFSDFNPNDMEATKSKILCVKGGKVVKYKG